jgi:hypothetical protein
MHLRLPELDSPCADLSDVELVVEVVSEQQDEFTGTAPRLVDT